MLQLYFEVVVVVELFEPFEPLVFEGLGLPELEEADFVSSSEQPRSAATETKERANDRARGRVMAATLAHAFS
jgi:hypothetical protein